MKARDIISKYNGQQLWRQNIDETTGAQVAAYFCMGKIVIFYEHPENADAIVYIMANEGVSIDSQNQALEKYLAPKDFDSVEG